MSGEPVAHRKGPYLFAATPPLRGVASKIFGSDGKAEPFRSSGGTAAKK
jgi:hypothetical protein